MTDQADYGQDSREGLVVRANSSEGSIAFSELELLKAELAAFDASEYEEATTDTERNLINMLSGAASHGLEILALLKSERKAILARSALRIVEDEPQEIEPSELVVSKLEVTLETSEVIIDEPVELLSTETEERLAEPTGDIISERGERFLVDCLGDDWDKVLGVSKQNLSIAEIVFKIIANIPIKKPNTVEKSTYRLTGILRGLTDKEIMEHNDEHNDGAIGMFFTLTRARLAKAIKDGTFKNVDYEPAKTDIESEVETPDSLTMPRDRSIINDFARRAELDAFSKKALRGYLDPHGSEAFDEELAQKALAAIVEHITERFGSIENEALELSDDQKQVLRLVTGAWYKRVGGQPFSNPSQPLAHVITKLKKVSRPEATTRSFFNGLDAIIDADKARMLGQKKVEIQKEKEADKTYIIDAALRPDEVDLSRWETKAYEKVIGLAAMHELPPSQAEALWERVHFDREGNVQDDDSNPEGRAALALLKEKLITTDSEFITKSPRVKMALQLLLVRGVGGVKTLSDVYEKLHIKDEEMTKEKTEILIVAGVSELLK